MWPGEDSDVRPDWTRYFTHFYSNEISLKCVIQQLQSNLWYHHSLQLFLLQLPRSPRFIECTMRFTAFWSDDNKHVDWSPQVWDLWTHLTHLSAGLKAQHSVRERPIIQFGSLRVKSLIINQNAFQIQTDFFQFSLGTSNILFLTHLQI